MFLSFHFDLLLFYLPFVTKGMRKTTQAMRKTMLPTKFKVLWSLIFEATKKPAHTRNRIQPQRWNFLSRFPSSPGIVLVSHDLATIKQ